MQLKDILKILGALLIPLMLGIATTVLAIEQTKFNQDNRQNDIDIAKQQRQQDAYLADQSEKERILATYLQDISTLLLEKNVTFNQDSMASIVIRAKTLTTLRQLDIERKRRVILFLYETKLIMKNGPHAPINLVDVELDHLDMSLSKSKQRLFPIDGKLRICFRGVSLVNSSFVFRELYSSDFSNTDLSGANFTGANLVNVDFTNALLCKTDFTNAAVGGAVFAYANLSGSNISDRQLSQALTFQGAIFQNGTTAPLKNLVTNGDAEQECSNNKTSLPLGWYIKNGSISAVRRPRNKTESRNECYFSTSSFYNISAMRQEVDLGSYSNWIGSKKASFGLNVALSGIKNGKHDIIVNLRLLSSDRTVMKNVTICSRPIIDNFCDSRSLISQEPRFLLFRDIQTNDEAKTKSVDIEIIFKRRTDHNVTLSEDNAITSCDDIAFYLIFTS